VFYERATPILVPTMMIIFRILDRGGVTDYIQPAFMNRGMEQSGSSLGS
jgi:hypothetical protein